MMSRLENVYGFKYGVHFGVWVCVSFHVCNLKMIHVSIPNNQCIGIFTYIYLLGSHKKIHHSKVSDSGFYVNLPRVFHWFCLGGTPTLEVQSFWSWWWSLVSFLPFSSAKAPTTGKTARGKHGFLQLPLGFLLRWKLGVYTGIFHKVGCFFCSKSAGYHEGWCNHLM